MIHASIVASSEGYPTIAMVEKLEEKHKDDNNHNKEIMANDIAKGIDNKASGAADKRAHKAHQ